MRQNFRGSSSKNFKLILLSKIKAPPKSPDLNPIEWLWHDLKTYVREQFCQTEEETILAIEAYQRSLTPEKCRKFIEKLPEVIFNIQ